MQIYLYIYGNAAPLGGKEFEIKIKLAIREINGAFYFGHNYLHYTFCMAYLIKIWYDGVLKQPICVSLRFVRLVSIGFVNKGSLVRSSGEA